MLRSIKSRQRMPRQLAIKVVGTGTAAIAVGRTEATLVDNGTGDYTLTFAQPFARVPVAVASAQTAGVYCEVIPSATAVQVLCKETDGTPAAIDAIFHLIVLGFDASDEY